MEHRDKYEGDSILPSHPYRIRVGKFRGSKYDANDPRGFFICVRLTSSLYYRLGWRLSTLGYIFCTYGFMNLNASS